jgi:hydroxysqualene dehydroxylase
MIDRAATELRDLFWRDVALAYRLPPHPVPPARIVKERRATFLASPEQLKRRPKQTTAWRNLLLAGDYVDTGLPATIEGAIRSGFAAARLATDCQPPAFSDTAASRGWSAPTSNHGIKRERHSVLP